MRPGRFPRSCADTAEGLVKRMYEQLNRIGVKDEALQNVYALWLIEPLNLDKRSEVKLIVDAAADKTLWQASSRRRTSSQSDR